MMQAKRRRLLIGLCGRKGSGKTTAGRMLCEELGWAERAFADPLKHGIQALFGLSREQLWGDEKDAVDPDWGVAPRRLLQYLGTDVVRNQLPAAMGWPSGTNPWVIQMERALRAHWEEVPEQGIVLTDVRFPDEVALIRRLGGEVWEVRRPEPEGLLRDDHESEGRTDLAPDAAVWNGGTRDELRQQLRGLLRQIST